MQIARIHEIFESVQGEGIYLGQKQLFIRFFGCNLRCNFCDTQQGIFKEYSVLQLREDVLQYFGFHSISLTGGEPLLQVDFLKEFLESIQGLRHKVYLETNGVLVDALSEIIDSVDIIAMDFKLPSSTKAGIFWKCHEDFLKLSLKKEVFVKMVITRDTAREDILTARDIVKRVSAFVPVILQPHIDGDEGLLIEKMISFKKDFILSGVCDVRIIPQAHKLAGIK